MNLCLQSLFLCLLLSCSLVAAEIERQPQQFPQQHQFHQQQQQQQFHHQQQQFQQQQQQYQPPPQQQQYQQKQEDFRTPHEPMRNDRFIDPQAQVNQQVPPVAAQQQQQQAPPVVPQQAQPPGTQTAGTATTTAQKLGEIMNGISFEPPFIEIEGSGNRIVPNWRTSGTTVVNTNFIRLTPDRQSKKGALWSRRSIGTSSISSIFKFRISGQGKQFFGDGIALWFTQDSYYTEGILHGFKEKFKGFAIIFDTFKNLESVNVHRDVTVLVNDGQKTWEMMTQSVEGCNINVRYHNDRADFSVEDVSKAKIIINGNSLELYIDAKNTGEWTECTRLNNLPFDNNWLVDAHVGITGTTGQLADNHDVISFTAYSDPHTLSVRENEKENKRLFESMPNLPIADRVSRLEDAINYIFGKLDYTAHYLEHEFASIDDHIDSVTNKLKSREDSAEIRIENLEEAIRKRLDESISSRLTKLEQSMSGNVDRKLSSFEASFDKKLSRDGVPSMSGTPIPEDKPSSALCDCSNTPFYASIVFNVLACGWFYYIFNVSKKKHLL